MLRQALGEAAARHLHELAWARDPRPVSVERVEKSVGAETTFDEDVAADDVIRRTMLGLATRVGVRLRQAGQSGRTVAIKVRLADFRTLNRSRTLATPTDVTRDIFETAWALYEALRPGDRIRLIGVRVEGLAAADEAPEQLTLDGRGHGLAGRRTRRRRRGRPLRRPGRRTGQPAPAPRDLERRARAPPRNFHRRPTGHRPNGRKTR
jgi:DNA polymerase-4